MALCRCVVPSGDGLREHTHTHIRSDTVPTSAHVERRKSLVVVGVVARRRNASLRCYNMVNLCRMSRCICAGCVVAVAVAAPAAAVVVASAVVIIAVRLPHSLPPCACVRVRVGHWRTARLNGACIITWNFTRFSPPLNSRSCIQTHAHTHTQTREWYIVYVNARTGDTT